VEVVAQVLLMVLMVEPEIILYLLRLRPLVEEAAITPVLVLLADLVVALDMEHLRLDLVQQIKVVMVVQQQTLVPHTLLEPGAAERGLLAEA
jgi:hypothetical protein